MAIPQSRMPRPQSMDSPEREYLRSIFIYQRAYERMMSDGLMQLLPKLKHVALAELPIEMRHDAELRLDANIEAEMRKLFAQIQTKLQKMFPDSVLKVWSHRMTTHVNEVNKKNIVKVGKAAELDIEKFINNKKLSPYFQNIVDENIGLIRSIPESKLPALKNAMVLAISQDQSQDTIRKLIQKNFDATHDQAKLIARDQVNKLNGQLNQYRQQQLGGRRYIWRTSMDERVAGNPTGLYPNSKPSHWDREGKTYSWDKPPEGGHPGRRVRCRCTAEIILDDIVE
jgi:SPP1 gp7 family putative phage head morphogenesis protein